MNQGKGGVAKRVLELVEQCQPVAGQDLHELNSRLERLRSQGDAYSGIEVGEVLCSGS